MKPEFWRDKRVLLTGHTGFKGSWLSLWLQSLGAHVTGYSLVAPTEPSLFEVARVAEGMESIEGDVRDLEHLRRVTVNSQAEIVIHMAAQSLVRRSYLHPVETYETNVMGTVNVLEAVRSSHAVKAVLVVTSDKCYENREWVWGYRENDPMGGYDPYSSSKGCAELVTAAFQRSFFNSAENGDRDVAVATARAGNVIGGGDWAEDRLVPDLLRGALRGHEVAIRNPQATRPWQYVLEPLRGYLLLTERLYERGPLFAGGWNFGPREEDARHVGWVVESLTKLWGDGARWSLDRAAQPHEANYLKLDCSKATAKLGWRPQWDVSGALEATVAWYKAYASGEDMYTFSLEQLRSYQHNVTWEASA
jgi:CDP-glucose 4,6-dehydratase